MVEEDVTEIAVENFETSAGEYVYIPITISNNKGISSFNMNLDYNADYLTPISVIEGDILSGGAFESSLDDLTDGMLSVCWIDSDNIYEDGTLFTVQFLVSNDVQIGQDVSIELSCVDGALSNQELESVTKNVTQGNIKIVELLSEDVTENFNDYYINNSVMSKDGKVLETIPEKGGFDLILNFEGSSSTYIAANMYVALYAVNGALISVENIPITEEMYELGVCETNIAQTDKNINEIKIFIWDTLGTIKPMSESCVIKNNLN